MLQHSFYTMSQMGKIFWTKGLRVIVVEIQMQTLAHGVEAVDEVDAVDCCDVGIVAVAPGAGDFDCLGRIFAEGEDLRRCDDVGSDVCEALPGCVYGGAGRLAIDGFVVG